MKHGSLRLLGNSMRRNMLVENDTKASFLVLLYHEAFVAGLKIRTKMVSCVHALRHDAQRQLDVSTMTYKTDDLTYNLPISSVTP
jgi:hypothetical protein